MDTEKIEIPSAEYTKAQEAIRRAFIRLPARIMPTDITFNPPSPYSGEKYITGELKLEEGWFVSFQWDAESAKNYSSPTRLYACSLKYRQHGTDRCIVITNDVTDIQDVESVYQFVAEWAGYWKSFALAVLSKLNATTELIERLNMHQNRIKDEGFTKPNPTMELDLLKAMDDAKRIILGQQ